MEAKKEQEVLVLGSSKKKKVSLGGRESPPESPIIDVSYSLVIALVHVTPRKVDEHL